MRENESSGAETAGKKAPFAMMAVLAVSCAAGGTIGGALIGPKLTGAAPAAKAETKASDSGHGKSKEGGEHGVESLFTLESLVVNPAGTAGTRFLILSLALDVSGSVDALKN